LPYVIELQMGTMAALGDEANRLAEKRSCARLALDAIVMLAHIPLWTIWDRGAGAPPTPRRRCAVASVRIGHGF